MPRDVAILVEFQKQVAIVLEMQRKCKNILLPKSFFSFRKWHGNHHTVVILQKQKTAQSIWVNASKLIYLGNKEISKYEPMICLSNFDFNWFSLYYKSFITISFITYWQWTTIKQLDEINQHL